MLRTSRRCTDRYRPYQRILWRKSTKDPPITYQLRTVTYGTASAPFLATRTLMQVALDNPREYPEESNEIINNFYVATTCLPHQTYHRLFHVA